MKETTYTVFSCRKDKRYKEKFNPLSFHYISIDFDNINDAKYFIKSLDDTKFIYGIETRTKYI